MYQIERRGYCDGYKSRDVDGKLLGDEDVEGVYEDGWFWEGMLEELMMELDVEDIFKWWKQYSLVS